MSDETILAEPVKEVKKRAPKKRSIFFKRHKEDVIPSDIALNYLNTMVKVNVDDDEFGSERLINVYTDFIPLSYLFLTLDNDFLSKPDINYILGNSHNFYKLQSKENEVLPNMFCRYLHTVGHSSSLDTIIAKLAENVKKYISISDMVPLNAYFDAYTRSIGDINNFMGFSDYCGRYRYRGRTIRLTNIHNSLYYEMIESPVPPIPTYISVVLPENYLYQKYHILATGKVDASKVIILVNDDVDHVSFSGSQSVRKYHKSMLDKLISKGYQTWNVPQQFILDNCFVKKHKVTGKSSREINKKLDELIREFGEYMKTSFGNTTEYVVKWAEDVLESSSPSVVASDHGSNIALDYTIRTTYFSDSSPMPEIRYIAAVDPVFPPSSLGEESGF